MSNTRRQTLVAVLQGTNGYTLAELNAMNKVKGVNAFLQDAEARGISHTALADRLVAFKTNGGSGLADAIVSITGDFTAPEATDSCKAAVEQAKVALAQAIAALDAVS